MSASATSGYLAIRELSEREGFKGSLGLPTSWLTRLRSTVNLNRVCESRPFVCVGGVGRVEIDHALLLIPSHDCFLLCFRHRSLSFSGT
jgi:hypothetical protein